MPFCAVFSISVSTSLAWQIDKACLLRYGKNPHIIIKSWRFYFYASLPRLSRYLVISSEQSLAYELSQGLKIAQGRNYDFLKRLSGKPYSAPYFRMSKDKIEIMSLKAVLKVLCHSGAIL